MAMSTMGKLVSKTDFGPFSENNGGGRRVRRVPQSN